MPKPRYRLVSLSDTPHYHCNSRCVQRAYLRGVDSASGYKLCTPPPLAFQPHATVVLRLYGGAVCLRRHEQPLLKYPANRQPLPVNALGPASRLRDMAANLGMKFLRGVSLGNQLYPEPG